MKSHPDDVTLIDGQYSVDAILSFGSTPMQQVVLVLQHGDKSQEDEDKKTSEEKYVIKIFRHDANELRVLSDEVENLMKLKVSERLVKHRKVVWAYKEMPKLLLEGEVFS